MIPEKFKATLITLTIAIAYTVNTASAYSFMPMVTCYSHHENKCATQAWDATQDNKGTLYFATSDGMLMFDGVRWEYFKIPGATTIRSIEAIGNRVYVGAYKQIGYFERDETNRPVYHSITPTAKDYEFRDDEFWTITSVGKNVCFQSFRSIFVYDGDDMDIIYINRKGPLNLFNIDGKLYTQLIYGDFCTVDSTGYHSVTTRDDLSGNDVVGTCKADNGEIILFTEKNGLLKLTPGNELKTFKTDIDKEVKSHCINRVIETRDGSIVIGTLQNGVYCINKKGELKWHYNIENGLGNNTILGLKEDRSGNVWVMMDHGISLVHSGMPYLFLKPGAGEPYMGMTYSMLRDNDLLYVGTNQGFYAYSFNNGEISCNELLKSQIWHTNSFDNQIFIGGGTLSANVKDLKIGNLTTNGSTDIKKGKINNQEVLVESSYYALRIHRRDPSGRWRLSHEVTGFGAPVRQIEIDSDGSVWCSHMAKGVMRVELSRDLDSVERIETYIDAGSGHQRATSFVMKIRGQIVVSDGDSLYRYDSGSKSLKPFWAILQDLPSEKEIYSSTAVDDKTFWLASRQAYTLVEYVDGHYHRLQSVPLDHLTLQSNGVNNKVYVDDDRNCYFSINNGVGLIKSESRDFKNYVPSVTLAAVLYIDEADNKQRLPIKSDKSAKTECSGNITFKLSYPSYDFSAHKFMFQLDGPEKRCIITNNPEVSFVGLKHGDYKFEAALIDDKGDSLAHADYNFTVPRPAYLSYWAMSGYVLVFATVGMCLSKLYARRQLKRQQRDHEIERVAQNIQLLEKERIIAEQQRQLLQNQLDLKSKELASLALEAGYKGQVIENLRETLSGQRRKGQLDSREIDSLIKTINSDIDKTEFWNIFHNNFDLIHENFFRNLRNRFPELTPTDLKFCALMRLNMSTKDIASFTHLTIRGVETARYRIRRKLNLDPKASIVQYLIDFK